MVKSMAISSGYSTDFDAFEFIYAFVGDIQYQYDSMNYNLVRIS
ncbi:MAG: hypothetical protein CM15mP71_5740 [Candidatus Poseidoniales archaeon]|nr:MAG: hypothetical protein CM15mP71_5740 [Candidatus Poseidoniales archaeon]